MNDKITNRYNEALTKLKIKNKDIVEKLNYSATKASDFKTGKNNITPEFALELEKDFGINPCWLFFGYGELKKVDQLINLDGDEKEVMSYEELYKKVNDLATSVKEIKEKYEKD